MRDFQTKKIDCLPQIRKQFDIDRNLVDLWFHRISRLEKDLDKMDKDLLNINLTFITLAKVIYSVRQNELLDEQWIYNSYNSSLIIGSPASTIQQDFYYQDCIPGVFQEPYDPRCRSWYKIANDSQEMQFQKPYVFAFDETIGMTTSYKIIDDAGQDQSILSIDFGITNLVDKVFMRQDQNDESSIYEGYSVFFHEDNKTVFNHKYWNRKDGILKNWKDLEFNSTSLFPQEEINMFDYQLTQAINATKYIKNYDEYDNELLSPLFMDYIKGDKEYLALVYPIIVSSTPERDSDKNIKVMYIARVQRKIVQLILTNVLKHSSILVILVVIETIIVSTLVIISLLHFTAILVHQISIPLERLTYFLKHSSLLILNKKEQENSQITFQNQKINQSIGSLIQNKSKYLQNSQYTNNNLKRNSVYSKDESQDNSKLRLLDKSNQNIKDKDKSLKKTQQSMINMYGFIQPSKGDFIETKIDEKFVTFPTKINDISFADKNTSLNNKTKQKELQKSRWKIESTNSTINNKQKEILKKIGKKAIDAYQMQVASDISEVKSSFKEISIIKKTFKILAKIIQFEREGLFASDKTESLLRFSRANKIFSKIQNKHAMALCHYNIAKLHLEDTRYQEAIEQYQLSLNISVQALGFSDVQSFQIALLQGCIPKNEFFILHIKYVTNKLGNALKLLVQDSLILKFPSLLEFEKLKSQKTQTNKNIYDHQYAEENIISTYLHSQQQLDLNVQECLSTAKKSLSMFQLSLEIEKKQIPYRKYEMLLNMADQAELQIYLGYVQEAQEKVYFIRQQLGIETHYNNENIIEDDYEKLLDNTKYKKISLPSIHILDNRAQFLQGLILMKQNQYYQATLHFTSMIESSFICESQEKLVALCSLHQIFQKHELSTYNITKLLLREKHLYSQSILQTAFEYKFKNIKSSLKLELTGNFQLNQDSYDIIVMLSTNFSNYNLQREYANYQVQFLEWLYKFFLQSKRDKISVINYTINENEERNVNVILPLITVDSDKLLKIIINSFLNINKEYQRSQFLKQFIPDYQESEDIENNINNNQAYLLQKRYSQEIPLHQCMRYFEKENLLFSKQIEITNKSKAEDSLNILQNNRIPLIIYFSNSKTENIDYLNNIEFKQLYEKYYSNVKMRFPKILQITPNDIYENSQLIRSNCDDIYTEILMSSQQDQDRILDSFNISRNAVQQNDQLFQDLIKSQDEQQDEKLKFHIFQSTSKCKLYLLRKRIHTKIQYFKE